MKRGLKRECACFANMQNITKCLHHHEAFGRSLLITAQPSRLPQIRIGALSTLGSPPHCNRGGSCQQSPTNLGFAPWVGRVSPFTSVFCTYGTAAGRN